MTDKPATRRIVKSPMLTLHEILGSQLDMLLSVAVMRPLEKEEVQRMELLLKIYNTLPMDQQLNAPGITITASVPTAAEIQGLLKIAKQ